MGFALPVSMRQGFFVSLDQEGFSIRLPESWSILSQQKIPSTSDQTILLLKSNAADIQISLIFSVHDILSQQTHSVIPKDKLWFLICKQKQPIYTGHLACGFGNYVYDFLEAGYPGWLSVNLDFGEKAGLLKSSVSESQDCALLNYSSFLFHFAWLNESSLRSRLSEFDHVEISCSHYNLMNLWILFSVRVSLPKLSLGLANLPSHLKPQWKRYCQNLNIICDRMPRPQDRIEIPLEDLLPEVSIVAASCNRTWQFCEDDYPMIPNKLGKAFQSFD